MNNATNKSPRIGPHMIAILRRVVQREGDSILANLTGTRAHGSRKYGYAAAHRLISAGLVYDMGGGPRGQYRLGLTRAGFVAAARHGMITAQIGSCGLLPLASIPS